MNKLEDAQIQPEDSKTMMREDAHRQQGQKKNRSPHPVVMSRKRFALASDAGV